MLLICTQCVQYLTLGFQNCYIIEEWVAFCHSPVLYIDRRWCLYGGRQRVQWPPPQTRFSAMAWSQRGHRIEEEISGYVRLELEELDSLKQGLASKEKKMGLEAGVVSPGHVKRDQ